MRHGGGGGGAVPMLQAGGKPDHVSGAQVLDGPALALSPAETRDDDQHLAHGMRMPGGACARLERNTSRAGAGGLRRSVDRVDAYCAAKISLRPLAGWLRAVAYDLQEARDSSKESNTTSKWLP